MMVSIEQHVEYLSDAITHAQSQGRDVIEPTLEAQEEWIEHVTMVGEMTLFPKANSWYMGANVPGKVRVLTPYLGGLAGYIQKCDEIAADGYAGFAFSSSGTLATA